MFNNAVYRRGAMTLQALREKIGDGPFVQILRTWTDQHRYGTATTEEFIDVRGDLRTGPVELLPGVALHAGEAHELVSMPGDPSKGGS
jgi:hypothetical protein